EPSRRRRVGAGGAAARWRAHRAMGRRRARRRRSHGPEPRRLRGREHHPPPRARRPRGLRPGRSGPRRPARPRDRALALRAPRRAGLAVAAQPVGLRCRLRRAGRAHRCDPRDARPKDQRRTRPALHRRNAL
ncbi:MAG: hypothetical protein AVDCRST_MAG53-72, partial [uncultured Solirubrobacteraceae bacterium]